MHKSQVYTLKLTSYFLHSSACAHSTLRVKVHRQPHRCGAQKMLAKNEPCSYPKARRRTRGARGHNQREQGRFDSVCRPTMTVVKIKVTFGRRPVGFSWRRACRDDDANQGKHGGRGRTWGRAEIKHSPTAAQNEECDFFLCTPAISRRSLEAARH